MTNTELIKISENQINEALTKINHWHKVFGFKTPARTNVAKKLSEQLPGKIPLIIASEFLAGNAHVLANQINENAKTFADYFLSPEIGHHLIEGLTFPKANRQNLFFIFLKSKLYYPRNQLRYRITEQIVKKNKIKFASHQLVSSNKLDQVIEMLVFGSYVGFYLAILNKINPNPIPWVDYLKGQLKKN